MELGDILRTLWRCRGATAGILVLAMVAGLAAGYRLAGLPLHLEPRTLPLGVATKQLYVDAPQSALADLKLDATPMVGRAGAVAQILSSREIRDRMAHLTGVPVGDITSEGPYTGAASALNVVTPSEARGMQVIAERKPYRLWFRAQRDLPVVTIHAQAPDPAAAAAMADASARALHEVLADLQRRLVVPAARPIVVRDMGPATAGSLHSGIGKAVVLLSFAAVAILGLLALVSLAELTRRVRGRAAAAAERGPEPA